MFRASECFSHKKPNENIFHVALKNARNCRQSDLIESAKNKNAY